MASIVFAPVRLHQWAAFLRLNLHMIAPGDDPWVDAIKAHPWAPASLLEYAYMLARLPVSDPYFLVEEGRRIGALWLTRKGDLFYMLSFGLLPEFRNASNGLYAARLLIRTIRFVEEYALRHRCWVLVLRMAAQNHLSQKMAETFGCRDLGLDTSTLTFPHLELPPPAPGIRVRRLSGRQTRAAWRRWRLAPVIDAAGDMGVAVANRFVDRYPWIDPPPRGLSAVLERDGQEVGFACAAGRDLTLFCLPETYPWQRTGALVAALRAEGSGPLRLTVSQSHAEALVDLPKGSKRQDGRMTKFVLAAWRPALASYFREDPP